MGKKVGEPNSAEVTALRTEIINFVRQRRHRSESAIIDYIMDKLRLGDCHISYRDAEYYLAQCVEAGPLMWFGANKPGHELSESMKYRYAPLVSQKEKRMEIEGLAEINTVVNLYKRCRKKEKPLEPVLETLNKLGSRRPTKQRFSLTLKEGTLTLRAKTTEYLPESLQKIADRVLVGEVDA